MLGRKTHAVDIAHGGIPTDFDTQQLAAAEQLLGFHVEEDDMLVDFEVSATYSGAAAGTLYLTLYVDGVNIGHATNGLNLSQLAAASAEHTVYFSHTSEGLTKGYHTVQVRTFSDTTPTLQAATIPSQLVARRHSHPATLGHGVDSKAQLQQ